MFPLLVSLQHGHMITEALSSKILVFVCQALCTRWSNEGLRKTGCSSYSTHGITHSTWQVEDVQLWQLEGLLMYKQTQPQHIQDYYVKLCYKPLKSCVRSCETQSLSVRDSRNPIVIITTSYGFL